MFQIAGQAGTLDHGFEHGAGHVFGGAFLTYGHGDAIDEDRLIIATDLHQVVWVGPEPIRRHIGGPGE